ncbi:uncharacterized protein LOC106162376 [Lingula anatina]|uniref:Uncharacterized protein LOC106162376 n=1 Tax=Lingula anatina TaxID=7574 RepID=A0A1S3IA22_LINAN|nr:uncharacterized protein LOC106162376 [Lingula anatina]|eukprot:XP_013395110.1 uncharacterized protein LOC106162376 [Lingula anatina]
MQSTKSDGGVSRPPLRPKPKLKTPVKPPETSVTTNGLPVAHVKPMVHNKTNQGGESGQQKIRPMRPPPPLPKQAPVGQPKPPDPSTSIKTNSANEHHFKSNPVPTVQNSPVPAGRNSPIPTGRISPVLSGLNSPLSSGSSSPVPMGRNSPTPKPRPRISKVVQSVPHIEFGSAKDKETGGSQLGKPAVRTPDGSTSGKSPALKPRPVPRKRGDTKLGETVPDFLAETPPNLNVSDSAVVETTDSSSLPKSSSGVGIRNEENDLVSKQSDGNESQMSSPNATEKVTVKPESSEESPSNFSNILKMFSSSDLKEDHSPAEDGSSPSRPPRSRKATKLQDATTNKTSPLENIDSKEEDMLDQTGRETSKHSGENVAEFKPIPPKLPILPTNSCEKKDTNIVGNEGKLKIPPPCPPKPDSKKRHSYESAPDGESNVSSKVEDGRRCRRSRSVGTLLDVLNDGAKEGKPPRQEDPEKGNQVDNPAKKAKQQVTKTEKETRKSDNMSVLERLSFSKKERTSSQSSVGSHKSERGRSNSRSQFFVESPLPKSRTASASGSVSSVEEEKEEGNKEGKKDESVVTGLNQSKFSQAQHMLSQVMKSRLQAPSGSTSQDKPKLVPARPAPPVPKKLPGNLQDKEASHVLPPCGDIPNTPSSPGNKRTTLERMQAEGLVSPRRHSIGDISQTSSEHIYSYLDDDDYELIKSRSDTTVSDGSNLYEQVEGINHPSSSNHVETSSVGSDEAEEYLEPIKTHKSRRASYEYVEPVVKAASKPPGYEFVEPPSCTPPLSPPAFVAPPPPKTTNLKHSQSLQACDIPPARPPRRKRQTVEVGNVFVESGQDQGQTAVPSIVVTQQSQDSLEGEEYFDMRGIAAKQDNLEGEEYFDMQGLKSETALLENNNEEEYFDMTAYKKVLPTGGDSHQDDTGEEYFDMQGQKPLPDPTPNPQGQSFPSQGTRAISCANFLPPPPSVQGHCTTGIKPYVNMPPQSPSAALITEDEYFDMSGVSRSPVTSDLSHDVSSDNNAVLEDMEYSDMSVFRDAGDDHNDYSNYRAGSESPTNSFSDSDSSFGGPRPLSTVDEDGTEESIGPGRHPVTMRLHAEPSRPDSYAESIYSEHSDGSQNEGQPKRSKIYYIAKEMMTSEKVFVEVLKLLNVEFRNFITEMTTEMNRTVIPNPLLCQLLNYLPQLEDFNEDLLKDLTSRVENWDEDPRIADIFVKKGPFLKLYTTYIREYEHTSKRFDEACKEYPLFAEAVKKFEAKDCCASLNLKAYMLKPIQRIPQYRLLLNDYKKHLPEDSQDLKDTEVALEIVSAVADHANEAMRQGDQFQKMLEVQSNLVGGFEVIKPGRVLLKQGTLEKLSRKVLQPRMFFLFNDVLLYTTPTSTGSFRLNHVLPLTGMKVSQPAQDDFQNEFSIISVHRSVTVSASTSDERDEWLKALQTAISDVMSKKKSFDVQMLLKETSYDKDFILGSTAPVWIPDSRVSMCALCTTEFTVTFRRHHCRACGKIVCSNCSDNKAPLSYMDNKSARVCDVCFGRLEKEFGEVSKYIPPQSGAAEQDGQLAIHPSKVSIKERFSKSVRNSKWLGSRKSRPSVLQEVHANDQGSEMSGYLKVWKAKKWKKLWFVIKDKVLYTYKASEDMAAVESTPLLGYDVEKATEYFEGVEPSLLFSITHQGRQPMTFRTEAPSARDKWVSVTRDATMP